MVDRETATQALLKAGYSPDEAAAIYREMEIAEGAPMTPMENIARGPTTRTARDITMAFGLPVLGGGLTGAATGLATANPWIRMGGRLVGEAIGGYGAGRFSGQTHEEALRTGRDVAIVGGVVEGGSQVLGRGLLRSRGLTAAEVAEVDRMPAGAAMKSTVPRMSGYPAPNTEQSMRLRMFMQGRQMPAESQQAMSVLLNEITRRGPGGEGVLKLGRELMEQGPVGDEARLMVGTLEKAIGLSPGEVSGALRQIATMRRLGETELANMSSITRMIVGAALGHNFGGIPGAVAGTVATGVAAGPVGVGMMKAAPALGLAGAGAASVMDTGGVTQEQLDEEYRRRLARQALVRSSP